MLRKYKVVSICLLLCVLLTGCVSEANRESIIEYLTKHGIIQDDWSPEIKYIEQEDVIMGGSKYCYIYTDKNDNNHKVLIKDSKSSKDGNSWWYPVEIISNVVSYDLEDSKWDNSMCSYVTIHSIRYKNSNKSESVQWYLKKHSFLWFEWYTISSEVK